MKNIPRRQLIVLLWLTALSTSSLAGNAAIPGAVSGIVGLCNSNGQVINDGNRSNVGLDDVLWVVVSTASDGNGSGFSVVPGCKGIRPTGATGSAATAAQAGAQAATGIDPANYALYLNGQEVKGIAPPVYDQSRHSLGFLLTRNEANRSVWAQLLGSPTSLSRRVNVALGRTDLAGPQPLIVGTDATGTFQMRIASELWLIIGAIATALVLVLVFGHARTRTTLRDNLLPQLEPRLQTYSLARCQMAFWFVLIFVSFLFLYVVLWDYNTVSAQALGLMGISSVTALAAIEVDVRKESPADAVNRALQALGLNSHEDVRRLQADIEFRKAELSGLPRDLAAKRTAAERAAEEAESEPEDTALAKAAHDSRVAVAEAEQLLRARTLEFQDRSNLLRTFREKSAPFVSQGWFKDLTTDLNGPTVHRLQVLFWTGALGFMFVVGVYRDLAMPSDFSATMLALMGISSAGYVGFKYPERND